MPIVFKRFTSFKKTFQFVFLFSFFIEFTQYFIGRSADIDDLILNTLGGVIGFMTYDIIVRLFFTKHEIESKEFEIK